MYPVDRMKWDFIKGIYEPFIGIDSFCFAFTKKGIHHSGLLCSGISNENLWEMILFYGKCRHGEYIKMLSDIRIKAYQNEGGFSKMSKFANMVEKNLYIIAGCNGADKTTASFTILPEIIECKEFVNADEIAKGLSPFQPEKVAFEAGRIMINRINELLINGETFAFETTLSTRSYRQKIETAKKKGYTTTLLFFWLKNVDLAKERVITRVLEGGHNIPPDVIERRYLKGIQNLFNLYLPIVDGAFIFDNSYGNPELIAQQTLGEKVEIINTKKFNELKRYL